MASVSDAVYPLRTFQEIITRDLTATNVTGSSIVSGSNVYGAYALITTISGSSISAAGGTFLPPTGSTSGSLVASLTVKVNITGSTYYIQLWA